MMNTYELKHACEMYVMSTYVEKAQERILTQLLNKLAELERLAEIGSAFEKSYSDNYRLIKNPYNTISNEFFSIKELIDWAKED